MQKNNDASLLTTSREKRKSQRKEKKREQGRETTRSDNPQSIKVAAIGRAEPSQAKQSQAEAFSFRYAQTSYTIHLSPQANRFPNR